MNKFAIALLVVDTTLTGVTLTVLLVALVKGKGKMDELEDKTKASLGKIRKAVIAALED